ncbi:unnamed protein product [Rotaria magnacalcarata]|uniref:PA domain-containing protein n=2 Tax=Rotaria magnacalcarata TaxID=392030 RepID=A0A814DDC4_9BILA|nr:unnamed protein product [Rotaria magnacalcarata]CAF1929367.1 unnamed protein product [Rotaria magnacalcarata]CAF1932912.1 unnamed protein product [Rotaria magnacalcarata]CAF3757739.1 unnamed protein product [Rotaria magnacalcarata]CAF3772525.1 unnamed protein product [Rotaria magnacalcarata]
MVLIDFYLIMTIFLPLTIHSLDQSGDYYRNVYFEVLEPSDISYTFRCRPANDFGTSFNKLLKNVYLIPSKPLIACSSLQNDIELKGNIALVERGDCSFVTKIINVQRTGALGAIVMNNDHTADERFVDMIHDSTERNVLIPAIFLQYRDGHMILKSIEKNHLIGARINIPLNLTYDEILKVHRAPGSYWL